MMLEKEKRKGQQDNLKRYWLIFGWLVIFLLFPIRLQGRWYGWDTGENPELVHFTEFNIGLYLVIGMSVAITLIYFIHKYSFKKNFVLIVLMILCLHLSLHHLLSPQATYNCDNSFDYNPITGDHYEDWIIFEPVWCTSHVLGAGGWIEFIGIKNTLIAIDVAWIKAYFLPHHRLGYGM